MSDAKRCDRCKKFYVKPESDVDYGKFSIVKYYKTTGEKSIDLCPDCYTDLMEWMNPEKKKIPNEGVVNEYD